MSHRHYREFVHPDRGKCEVLGTIARKTIQTCGILLDKAAEGVIGAVRVWIGPGGRHGGRMHRRFRRSGDAAGRRWEDEVS